tara:strand:+ start:90 stop:476 length:387 start_codon:yes stop_codon:yes gene_type:complete
MVASEALSQQEETNMARYLIEYCSQDGKAVEEHQIVQCEEFDTLSSTCAELVRKNFGHISVTGLPSPSVWIPSITSLVDTFLADELGIDPDQRQEAHLGRDDEPISTEGELINHVFNKRSGGEDNIDW